DLVISASRQRHAIELVRNALRDLEENQQSHDEIMSRLYSANDEVVPSAAVPIQKVMLESLKRIEKAGDARAIIPTGFGDRDRQIGGVEKGELIVIAGRPSMGKTSIALDLELNA